MKSVQGHVLSSNPISLSDATSFLSDFTTSVCGVYSDRASQETRVFIRRALVSFQELDRLHRKLKDRRSDRNRRPTGSDTQNDDAETTTVQAQSFYARRDVISKGEIKEEDGGGIGEKRKKKKKSKKVEGEIKEEEDGESKMGSEEEKKKRRKSGESDGVEEQQEKRKKRRKH